MVYVPHRLKPSLLLTQPQLIPLSIAIPLQRSSQISNAAFPRASQSPESARPRSLLPSPHPAPPSASDPSRSPYPPYPSQPSLAALVDSLHQARSPLSAHPVLQAGEPHTPVLLCRLSRFPLSPSSPSTPSSTSPTTSSQSRPQMNPRPHSSALWAQTLVIPTTITRSRRHSTRTLSRAGPSHQTAPPPATRVVSLPC